MRVADMNESQIIRAILDQSDAMTTYIEFADDQIARLRAEMTRDGDINEREIESILRAIRQTMDECLIRLQSESKRIFIEVYTFAEMRTLLEFREANPELVAKGAMAGKMTAQTMMDIMRDIQTQLESRLEMQYQKITSNKYS